MERDLPAPAEPVVQSNINHSGDLTSGYLLWRAPEEVPELVRADQCRAQFELARPEGELMTLEREGLRLPLLRAGRGAPFLFVHGLGHDLSDWRQLFARRPEHLSFWALDLPGFGLADAPPRLTMRALEDALLAAAGRVLEATGARPWVVASSLGGHVALRAALRDPRLAGLSLLAPGGLYPVDEPARRAALSLYSVDALCARPDAAVVAGARRIFAGAGAERERLAARKLALHRSPLKRDYMLPFAQIVEDVFATQLSDEVSLAVPAQLVVGAGDVIVPPALVRAAARRHDLPLSVLPGVGHAPMLEAPERTLEVVLPFAREET